MRLAPLLLAAALLPAPASASTYQALCGQTPCTISLDAAGLSSPAGFLPTARIAQWFTGGQEGYNAGSGTAGALGGATAGAIGGALLLGPIGLLGGLIGGGLAGSKAGNTADLFFNVVGYDQSGRKTTVSFRFINPKPANQLRMELPMFTGLAMGQTRSLDDLRAALSGSSTSTSTALPEQLVGSPTLPASGRPTARPRANTSTPGGSALPDSLTTPAPIPNSTAEEAWQTYLEQRQLVEWARSNPRLAEQLRQQMFPQP